MGELILAIFFLSFVALNILIGIEESRKAKRYHSLYKAEHTKSFFAKARNEMMCLAIEKKVDTNTDFFRRMYHLNTIIMRNPDEYADISRELTTTLLNIRSTKKQILTDEEKKISYLTAEALGHIVINYSVVMRLLFALTKRAQSKMNHAKFISFLAHMARLDHKIKAEREIKKTQSELYRISNGRQLSPC